MCSNSQKPTRANLRVDGAERLVAGLGAVRQRATRIQTIATATAIPIATATGISIATATGIPVGIHRLTRVERIGGRIDGQLGRVLLEMRPKPRERERHGGGRVAVHDRQRAVAREQLCACQAHQCDSKEEDLKHSVVWETGNLQSTVERS
jgi:hypothetical protein